MTAKEYLESKSYPAAGKVNTSDAIVAIELAEMEGALSVYETLDMKYHIQGQQKAIDRFKEKNNINP